MALISNNRLVLLSGVIYIISQVAWAINRRAITQSLINVPMSNVSGRNVALLSEVFIHFYLLFENN